MNRHIARQAAAPHLRPSAELVHQVGERVTAAAAYIAALRKILDAPTRHACPQAAALVDRALAQLNEACDAVSGLRETYAEAYRVRFMNHFSRGAETFTVCQRAIVISGARSREDAVGVAKRRFAEIEGVPDWHLRASAIETELIRINVEPGKQPANS